MKRVWKQFMPPIAWEILGNIKYRYRFSRRLIDPRNTRGQFHETHSKAWNKILADAKNHLNLSKNLNSVPDAGDRWRHYLNQMKRDIPEIQSVSEAIHYCQSWLGIDHRNAAELSAPYVDLSLKILKSEFPQSHQVIDSVSDSEYSKSSSLIENGGRLLSNVFLWHLREFLFLNSRLSHPQNICEIGGGYGGLSRIFLTNPDYRPELYVIVDFPETLFFAEIFLGVNLKNTKIIYVDDKLQDFGPFEKGGAVILCPISNIESLKPLEFDVVLNTGSMQEMTDAWIDFWMNWLEVVPAKYFYSVNNFAQPLSFLAECQNMWSPRLPKNWHIRHQRYNSPFFRIQSGRNFAEILAERVAMIDDQDHFYRDYFSRIKGCCMDGQLLLESMDVVRRYPHEEIVWDVLKRCVHEMPEIPKESVYLLNLLGHVASKNFTKSIQLDVRRLCSAMNCKPPTFVSDAVRG